MAQFENIRLTNNGLNLLAKVLTGKQLKFSRAWAGDGFLPDGAAIDDLQDIITPRCEMKILNLEVPPFVGTAKITVELTNKDLIEGFFLREIGLYAIDPDTDKEILYSYSTAGNIADFIPGQSGINIAHYVYALTTVIGQASDVTAVFADNPLNVTYIDLQKSMDAAFAYTREKEKKLQDQINILAEISIRNSINHVIKE